MGDLVMPRRNPAAERTGCPETEHTTAAHPFFSYTAPPQNTRDIVIDHSDFLPPDPPDEGDFVIDRAGTLTRTGDTVIDRTGDIWDVLVVGAGPAGCTAALYAAQAGLSVLLLEKQGAGGQMLLSSGIDNWPGEGAPVDGMVLGERMRTHAQRAGALLRYGTAAGFSLTEEVKTVTLAESPAEPIRARHVILAMGASPRMPGLPEEETLLGHGLSFCAACDGRLCRGQNAAVIGGGNTAAHDTAYLSRMCRHVTLIHRRDTFRIPAAHLEALRRLPNVTILTPYTVSAFRTAAEPVRHITGLRLTHTETGASCEIDCDSVFCAIGSTPATAMLRGILPLAENGAVITDALCRTALPGVFAVGDCRHTEIRQILTACADGCTAALQISDGEQK